jgi:hypothetical protein
MHKRIAYLFLALVVVVSSKAQNFVHESATTSEVQKRKKQHFSGVIHVAEEHFYTFGSESSIKTFHSPDRYTSGNSFITEYDSKSLLKTNEWDLGELKYLGEEVELKEISILKNKGYGIFFIEKKGETILLSLAIKPHGKIGKFKELYRTKTDESSLGIIGRQAPDSSHYLLQIKDRNYFKSKVSSDLIVFNENFDVVYKTKLQTKTRQGVAQIMSNLELDKEGNIYYITYENNPKRKTKSYMGDISSNRYHLYKLSENENLKHYSFSNEERIFHNLSLIFDQNSKLFIFGFYSGLDAFDKEDSQVKVEGLVNIDLGASSFESPIINYQPTNNTEINSLVKFKHSTGDAISQALSAASYQKSFFNFTQLITLNNGSHIVSVQHRRYFFNGQSSSIGNTNLMLLKLTPSYTIQSMHNYDNYFAQTGEYLSESHTILSLPNDRYLLLFDISNIEKLAMNRSDYNETKHALIGVNINRTGTISKPDVLLGAKGRIKTRTFDFDQSFFLNDQSLVVPTYIFLIYKMQFLKLTF